MAAQFQPDETSGPNPQGSFEEDAAALQDLVRYVQLTRPLQPGEEQTLLERAALGDRPSEDRLVAGHLAMVIRLAGSRGDQGLSVADLVQEGSIGLVEAVRAFAGSGAPDFASFAEARVGAQMDAAVEAEAAAVRDAHLLVNAATDYERTEILMRHELGRDPTTVELAAQLGWPDERVAIVAGMLKDARARYDSEIVDYLDDIDAE
jgi:DNA-directed RNA polymerase sigma subunit (sigma70/sigma32)